MVEHLHSRPGEETTISTPKADIYWIEELEAQAGRSRVSGDSRDVRL